MNEEKLDLACVPRFFEVGFNSTELELEDFIAGLPSQNVFDKIHLQLQDLVKLENPHQTHSKEFIRHEIDKKLNGRFAKYYGVWVYYPWLNKIVHLLPKDEFIAVRTVRNRYKITKNEQDELLKKRIGIVGLSVGQSAALTVAMERICGEIRLADFDHLELSNLNRIRTGVFDLGLLKTVAVAREISEIDPFIKVTTFHEGILETNVSQFFDVNGPLDLLIEECDSIEYKILLRQESRKRGIPVIMDTSDRGMLDVERYDLDMTYPILHNKIDPAADFQMLSSLKTSEEKLPFILPILDINSISLDFKASGLEVGKSITTWPQLASDVTLGGALCCNVARRILLGEKILSTRQYVDLSELIPATQENMDQVISMDEGFLDRLKVEQYVLGLNMEGRFQIPLDTLHEILNDAIKASSPGNSQRWLWAFHNNVLFLFLDKEVNVGFSDNFNFGSLIGLGCSIENLKISAAHKSIQVHIDWMPDANQLGHIVSITFERVEKIDDSNIELYPYISTRCCNRNDAEYGELSDFEINKLIQMCSEDVKFQLIVDKSDVQELGKLVCKGDRIRMTNIYGHQDFFMNEIRWSREESLQKGDGLDVTLFNLTALDKLGLELSKDLRVIQKLNSIEGGGGFERISQRAFIGASAVGIVWVDSYSNRKLVEAGMFIERLWLLTTEMKLGLQPYTVLQMLFTRLHKDECNYVNPKQRVEIQSLKSSFDNIVKPDENFLSVFLFRLNRADAPLEQSYRKPLSDKLIIT